ncbi:MAG: adenylate/guanylate cyclase domain-containing protein [Spirochaeta sp.]
MPWPSDSPGIRAGIGLHHGMLRLGTVGEQARLDVTVVSRVVNLAARLEKLTRRFDTGIIVSETIQAALPDREMRRLGSVRVKGIAEYITVYELLDGLPEGMRSARIQHRDAFDSAMNSLQAGRTEEANRAFRRILEEDPGDAAARYYLSQSAVV